jgi:hypothetical protein
MPIMKKLGRMLAQLIQHQQQHAILLSTMIIQAKQLTKFLSTLILSLALQMMMMLTGREVLNLPEQLRVLWLVTKNSTARGKKLQVCSLFITCSKELRVVNPLAAQDSWSNLLMLHTHQHPLSLLIKLCTFIVQDVMLIIFFNF